MKYANPYLIGAVDKALTALRLLRERDSMGVSELSSELDGARSTAHRILGTLTHHGFVEQDLSTRTYRLGPFLTSMGVDSRAVSLLRERAKPHMEALSAQFRETVQLMVLELPDVRFVDGVTGGQPLDTTVRRGTRVSAYATAGGKLLLAQLTDAQIRNALPRRLPGPTDHTIPTLDQLLEQVRLIRKNDFAVNDGESETGISAVAIPIRDSHGVAQAALAISLPSMRMRKENVPAMVEALRHYAQCITTPPRPPAG